MSLVGLPVTLLGLFDQISFFFQLLVWAVLFYMAYWLYKWVEEHLGFSQVLVFVVSGILIYFLVIEHPLLGALGIFGWMLIAGAFFVLLQLAPPVFMMFHRR